MASEKRESRDGERLEQQFRKQYFLVAMAPLVLLFLIVLFVGVSARNQVVETLSGSIGEINREAEENLRTSGEQLIITKARDLAQSLSIYFRDHPDLTLEGLKTDPLFRDMAVQVVGETGYTLVTETYSYRIVAHPTETVIGVDMRDFQETMPSLLVLVEEAITGNEMQGYYEWLEPDGSRSRKFMASSPVSVPVEGVILNATATIYEGEFSAPVVSMRDRARAIESSYREFMNTQWLALSAMFIGVAALALATIWWLAGWSARTYARPIEQLATAARQFGEGDSQILSIPEISARSDELGVLADALEQMSRQVSDLLERLASRVDELDRARQELDQGRLHLQELYESSSNQEKIYESLLKTSADPIVIFDPDGLVSYLNPAFTEVFGWTLDELEGKTLNNAPEDEVETREQNLARAGMGESQRGYEARRLTRDGRELQVNISLSRFEDHEGNTAGLLAVIRDQTEANRIREHVDHSERIRSLGNLAGGVAHDFNNLLMVIQGNVALLKDGCAAGSEMERRLTMIESQIESGSRLTRQLLGYARKGRYDVRVDDPNELLRQCGEAVNRMRKDVIFHYELAEPVSHVEADFFQLEQVVMNLLINAIDALPEGGDVYIRSWDESVDDTGFVFLEVRDNGLGMDESTLRSVFEPFFTTKEVARGTGLGLASALGIVEAHGGQIDVNSEPGQGSTFVIRLPASSKPIASKPVIENAASGGGETILFIDDEPSVLEVGKMMIETLGYNVIAVTDGEEGIDIFRDNVQKIDLLLLDMVMPGISGSAVFEAVRAIDPEIPVLLCSGYSAEQLTADILSSEHTDFIQKPYGISELGSKIKKALFSPVRERSVSLP